MNQLEHILDGNKDIAELFKNHTGTNARVLGDEIYNKGVLPYHRKTTIKAYVSLAASVAFYAGTRFLEDSIFELGCFAGLGFAGMSTVINTLKLLSIELTYTELMKQSKKLAGKVIKERLMMNNGN